MHAKKNLVIVVIVHHVSIQNISLLPSIHPSIDHIYPSFTVSELFYFTDSFINKFACQTAFVTCSMAEVSPYQMTGLNVYDITKECEVPPLCYDFSYIDTFLNLESTKAALHVTEESSTWKSCNMGINFKFHNDWMHGKYCTVHCLCFLSWCS